MIIPIPTAGWPVDAADIQNLMAYVTKLQTFFMSSESSNPNWYDTWHRIIHRDIQ